MVHGVLCLIIAVPAMSTMNTVCLAEDGVLIESKLGYKVLHGVS